MGKHYCAVTTERRQSFSEGSRKLRSRLDDGYSRSSSRCESPLRSVRSRRPSAGEVAASRTAHEVGRSISAHQFFGPDLLANRIGRLLLGQVSGKATKSDCDPNPNGSL